MRPSLSLVLLACSLASAPAAEPGKFEISEVTKIWDRGAHNAFTDLIRYKDRWYCCFREGKGHVSPDGALRVLTSAEGKRWESAALLTSKTADLRDPKLTITPDGRLQMTAAAALHDRKRQSHQTLTWFSSDGKDWGEAIEIGDPDYWLWRVTWHGKKAYGVSYAVGKQRQARLHGSDDGQRFTSLVPALHTEGFPNEATLLFQPDGTALCLLRRDGKGANGLLGTAAAPYREWKWQDVGARIGGPNLIRLPDGRLVAVVRLYDRKVRTAVCTLDPKTGQLTEHRTLPSGGDTSYAGLAWHENELWVSYYSSHEGKTAIYLARLREPGVIKLR